MVSVSDVGPRTSELNFHQVQPAVDAAKIAPQTKLSHAVNCLDKVLLEEASPINSLLVGIFE